MSFVWLLCGWACGPSLVTVTVMRDTKRQLGLMRPILPTVAGALGLLQVPLVIAAM
jgi:hypothetical protein